MSGSTPAEDRCPIAATRGWVERVVIGLDLCPFARGPVARGQARFVLSRAADAAELLAELVGEIERLEAGEGETSLLISPGLLVDFEDQLDWLVAAEDLIAAMGWEGRYQLVTFHPDYQFEGAPDDDPANWTNRSPYPMAHLLRWEDVARAADGHPDIEGLPARNVERLRAMGVEALRSLARGR